MVRADQMLDSEEVVHLPPKVSIASIHDYAMIKVSAVHSMSS